MEFSESTDDTPESPEIEIFLDGTPYIFRWDNTIVRQFKAGQGRYDHILFYDGEDYLTFFGTEAIRDRLVDADYPYTFDPVLDDYAIQCIASIQMLELTQELPHSNL